MKKSIIIEIWSDLLCPFCYIGKRHLEAALAEFEHRDSVQIIWRSFELDPSAEKTYEGDIYDMLAGKFGTSREQAKAMNRRVLEMGKQAGIEFNFDSIRPTNSFDAHRLVHLAATEGLQDKAEEKFFAGYFTEGRRLGDHEDLKKMALETGLEESKVNELLASDLYANEVRMDEHEARNIGVRGVPFFVFSRKYAVSGAQPPEEFLRLLQELWKETAG